MLTLNWVDCEYYGVESEGEGGVDKQIKITEKTIPANLNLQEILQ